MKLEQIIGLESAKESLDMDLRLRVVKDQPQKMILLEGASGSCKTSLIETIIHEWMEKYPDRFVYRYLDTGNVTGHVTTTSQIIEQYWDELRQLNKPIILFIDEAEEIMATRMNAGHIRTERTVNIMKQLNHEIPNLYIICATNRPKIIDRAILERCAERIHCPYPTPDELKQVIDVHLNFIGEQYKKELHQAMIRSGQRWSGRDIKHISDKFKQIIEVGQLTNPMYDLTASDVAKTFARHSRSKNALKGDYLEDEE